MNILKFSCTLESDVIINARSASQGSNNTLDFIPGNNFLGIVAQRLYKNLDPTSSFLIFHSGKVRFGDAHSMINGIRSLRIPLSMFYPKLSKPSEECIIHHFYSRERDIREHGLPMQLKQCRDGFYIFNNYDAYLVAAPKKFVIKSAYDREFRRSADTKMFGYESMEKGMIMAFSVEIDDEAKHLTDTIRDAMVGPCHIGRSRSAQFGLARIKERDYSEIETRSSDEEEVAVYADGRLIFLDDCGIPTFTPSVKQLGFPDGAILWEKSQVRTFQYAPWNSRRQAFDTDRCGLEKGSVLIVKSNFRPTHSKYVGSYKNEGFGKVVYNPDFLDVENSSNGKARYKIHEGQGDLKRAVLQKWEKYLDSPLIAYLQARQEYANQEARVYSSVNDFVSKKGEAFTNEKFASQWGSIRSIAMGCSSKKELSDRLFDEQSGYLKHGVALQKWQDKEFDDFFENIKDSDAQLVIVNLASEMAKKCNKREDGYKSDKL